MSTETIRYAIYRRHVDTEFSDAEVAAYADRLRGEIQAHYPGAAVEIVRNDSRFGGGLQGEHTPEVKQHIRALVARAQNDTASAWAGVDLPRVVHLRR